MIIAKLLLLQSGNSDSAQIAAKLWDIFVLVVNQKVEKSDNSKTVTKWGNIFKISPN